MKRGWLAVSALTASALLMGFVPHPAPAGDEPMPVAPPEKIGPLAEHMLYSVGIAHAALGNFPASRQSFTQIREINPTSHLAYAMVSRTYVAEGQLDRALFWVNGAQQIDPVNLEYAGWRVLLYDCLEDYDAARLWSDWLVNRVTNQPMPMAMQASHHYLSGNFELALQYSNLALNFNLPDSGYSDAIFMRIKRDEALGSGEPESGIRIFKRRHAELFREPVRLTADNLAQATDLALLLKMAGRSTATRQLLEAVVLAYERPYVASVALRADLAPVKAEALAILGDKTGALAELRRIIDAGWRDHWRWKTDLNPNFDAVRQSAAFRSMVAELEADMARQRSRVQEMVLQGEIELLPAVDPWP